MFMAPKGLDLETLWKRLVTLVRSAEGMYILFSQVRALSIHLHWLSSVIDTLAMVSCSYVNKKLASWAAMIFGRKSPYDSVMVVDAMVVLRLAVISS